MRGDSFTIAVIEDEDLIRKSLVMNLELEGFKLITAPDGEAGVELVKQQKPDLIIMDVMMPRKDGLQACRELRISGVSTPLILLTARSSEVDKVLGLDLGADDYLAKPFEFEELLARIRALLRRELAAKSAVVQVEDLVVDTAKRRVERGGRPIHLTPREYDLLVALAMRSSRILTREIIQQIVWNADDTSSNTVDAHMRNLRKKIDHAFPKKLIHTIYGVGYILKSEA